jgi:hypothetical protein
MEKERKKMGLVIKGIAPTSIRDKFEGRDHRGLLFIDLPIPLNITIFRNKVLFNPWEDKQISFLITSRQLADSFREYFYSIWNRYKK